MGSNFPTTVKIEQECAISSVLTLETQKNDVASVAGATLPTNYLLSLWNIRQITEKLLSKMPHHCSHPNWPKETTYALLCTFPSWNCCSYHYCDFVFWQCCLNYSFNLAPLECSVIANKPIAVQMYNAGFQRPLICCI